MTEKSSVQRYSGWYVFIAGLFVTCLLVANIIAVKILALPFGLFVPAGVVIFPVKISFAANDNGCSTEPLLVVLAIRSRTPSDIRN